MALTVGDKAQRPCAAPQKAWKQSRAAGEHVLSGSSANQPRALCNKTKHRMSVRDFNGRARPSLCLRITCGTRVKTQPFNGHWAADQASVHWTVSHCSAVESSLLCRIPGEPLHWKSAGSLRRASVLCNTCCAHLNAKAARQVHTCYVLKSSQQR